MTLPAPEEHGSRAAYPWIDVFSYDAGLTTFVICTGPETFDISLIPREHCFWLFRNDAEEAIAKYPSPYDAVIAVAQHRTGWKEWDGCAVNVSDYILDWRSHLDDCLRVRMICEWIDRSQSPGYRGLVDYFHFRYSYVMDRMKLLKLLTDLVLSGQVKKSFTDFMTPAEFKDLAELAKRLGM
jgi:hypothetical protein